MLFLRKSMLLFTAASISLSFVSCGNNSKSTSAGESTKISIMMMEGSDAPFREDWRIFQEIEERKNVKFDVQVVPGSDYNQKRAIVFASGEIPDIIVNTWPAEMSQYAMDGILLPVSDHIDKLPNLKKLIKDWELDATIENISEIDGKLYILPELRKELVENLCLGFREDIFNELSIPKPETYEDLCQAMIKIKAAYPDTLGTGDQYNGKQMMSFIAESFGTNGGFSLPWGYSYKFETNEWYFAPTSDEYRNFLSFMNEMYVNGCLDPEAFTQDSGQYAKKVRGSKYMVFPLAGPAGTGPFSAGGLTATLRETGTPDAKVSALYPLAGPTGLRMTKPSSRNQGGVAMPASVAKRKDFAEVMGFLDWLYYTEEAAVLTKAGFEGVTYDLDNGKYVMKSEIRTDFNTAGEVFMKKDYGIDIMGISTLTKDDLLPEALVSVIRDPERRRFERYLIDNKMVPEDDPIVKMNPEQKERVKLLVSKLNDYTDQMKMKFIFGQESFDTWDRYVQECQNKGSDELMNIVRTAWKENNKK